MGVQKEREAFLAHIRSIGSASFMFELDEDGNFDDVSMAYAWEAWQAAKAQSIPDGFVLVPKDPTSEMLIAADNCAINGKVTANIVYKAMIEAQEQK